MRDVGALILTKEEKRLAHRLATFAARLERWYGAGLPAPTEGADEATIQGYPCLFMWAVLQGVPHRLLFITGDRLPPRPHVVVLAVAFGFTGWRETDGIIEPGADWGIRHTTRAVAAWQRIGAAEIEDRLSGARRP